MMPCQSDGKMRRDGSSAARPQPSHPVAERGGLHGAPELSAVVARRIPAKRRMAFSAIEERRRWRRRSDSSHRLGLQTKDDRTHVILPVAAQLAVSDHARLPVMMPRQSDGKMRRDGSSAARPQPIQPVAERGGLHGAPDFSSPVARALAATTTTALTSQEERRRWPRRSDSSHRLGLQDKAGGPAAGTSFLSGCLHIVFRPTADFSAR